VTVKSESPVLTPSAGGLKLHTMSSYHPLSAPGRHGTLRLLAISLLVMTGCGRGTPLNADRFLLPYIDGTVSGELIEALAPLQRLPGTPDFDTALDLILDRLEAGGFAIVDEPPDGPPLTGVSGGYAFVLRDSLPYEIINPISARLEVTGPDGFTAADYDETPMVLAGNSRATPAGGLTTRMINLGNGTFDEEYEGVDVAGAIVYGRQQLADIYRNAVLERGAAGVVSASAPSWQDTDSHPDLVSWSVVGREGFGFKVSIATALRLEQAMERGGGGTEVRATVLTQPLEGRYLRTLVAEIPGCEPLLERVALVASFSGPAPGAGDVSGAAALVEAALAINTAIREGKLESPRRGIVFVWGATMMGTDSWARHHPTVVDELHSATVVHLLAGRQEAEPSRLLLEGVPDPASVWTRPPDEHTPWGAAILPYWPFEGHYLSLLTAEVAMRITGGDRGRPFATHPYEGGADHDELLEQLIPAQRLWSFPDPLYRSSLDSPGHVERGLVTAGAGVAAVTAYEIALADLAAARKLITLVYNRARERMEILIDLARDNLQVDDEGVPTAGDRFLEQEILNAWKIWYLEALETIRAHILPGEILKIDSSISVTMRTLSEEWDERMQSIGLVPLPLPQRLLPNVEF